LVPLLARLALSAEVPVVPVPVVLVPIVPVPVVAPAVIPAPVPAPPMVVESVLVVVVDIALVESVPPALLLLLQPVIAAPAAKATASSCAVFHLVTGPSSVNCLVVDFARRNRRRPATGRQQRYPAAGKASKVVEAGEKVIGES
jgi:hypothetical protein